MATLKLDNPPKPQRPTHANTIGWFEAKRLLECAKVLSPYQAYRAAHGLMVDPRYADTI